MKKTLDFNKLAKAHKAKKAWEKLQKEKKQNETESGSSNGPAKSPSAIRKSS